MEWSQGKGERFDIWGQGFEREREGADAGMLVLTSNNYWIRFMCACQSKAKLMAK